MSIDLAVGSPILPDRGESLDQLTIKSEAVYIFDFDGVISSRFEDDIYKLAPTEDELKLISSAAAYFGIRCEGMEQRYQRHLIYQAAAWKLDMPIAAGPGLEKALEASKISRLFILTARSGWYAVERLRTFLKTTKIQPIEIYNVGRVIKDRQVDLICQEFSSKRVTLIDDSAAHLQAIAPNRPCNLEMFQVGDTSYEQLDDWSLRALFFQTIRSAIAAP